MMKRSLVLCYTCLVKPLQLPRLPPRLNDLAGLIPDQADVIADIGTDHGLLAYAVAQRRPHSKVIGIDASSAALEQGASTLPQLPNLAFRLGNGLEGLHQTDRVDAVCMAGIGVNTMTEILCPRHLRTLNCQSLVLQPTGSRPRLLAFLYKHLSTNQWLLESESILYNSRRWYLTSLWHRNEIDDAILSGNDMLSVPGSRLHQTRDDVAKRWSVHHCKWIDSDWKAGSPPTPSEQLWLQHFRVNVQGD
jgi:tRNA A22 N-methylase